MPTFQQLPTLSFSIPYINKTVTVDTVDKNEYIRSPVEAAAYADMARLEQLLNDHYDFDTPGHDGLCALHYAASRGQLLAVQFLIEQAYATVDPLDYEEETPLLKAAYAGHFPVVRYLILHAGANIYHQDKDGWSCLHNACSRGHLEMVQFLICQSLDVNLKSKMSHTPLINAASKGHLKIVQHLVDIAHADPFCVNEFGETAYDAAAVAGEAYVCEQLEKMERARMRYQDYDLLKQHRTIPIVLYEYQQSETSLLTHYYTPCTFEKHQQHPWELSSGEQATKQQVNLPPLTNHQVWTWLTDWVIDYKHLNVDGDGWQYAKHFNDPDDNWTQRPPTSSIRASVRKRRWIRIMTLRPSHHKDGHDNIDDDSSQWLDEISSVEQEIQNITSEQWNTSNYQHRQEEASRPTSSTSVTRTSASFIAGTTIVADEDDDVNHEDNLDSNNHNEIPSLERRSFIPSHSSLQVTSTNRVWEKNEYAVNCRCCGRWFNFINRKHHCRQCGLVICDKCSTHRAILPYTGIIHDPHLRFDQLYKVSLQPQRICDTCFGDLVTSTPAEHPQQQHQQHQQQQQQRNSSIDSIMRHCPACGQYLLGYESTDEQEQHVQSCLNAGFSPASMMGLGYVLYQAPATSTLLGQECVICFEEFTEGDTIARLGCLCSYHHQCIHDWFSIGKGCPIHHQ